MLVEDISNSNKIKTKKKSALKMYQFGSGEVLDSSSDITRRIMTDKIGDKIKLSIEVIYVKCIYICIYTILIQHTYSICPVLSR